MDAQLRRGMLDVCVLAVLWNGDSYGYQIIKDLSQSVDISESTLYPILKRLEESNFVTVRSAEHNGRLRKYYSITAAGKARTKEFLDEWQSILKIYNFIKEKAEDDKA